MKKITFLFLFMSITVLVAGQNSNLIVKAASLSVGSTYDPGASAFGGAIQVDHGLSDRWIASGTIGYAVYKKSLLGVNITTDETASVSVDLMYNLTGHRSIGRNNIRIGGGAVFLHNSFLHYNNFGMYKNNSPWEIA